MHPAQRQKTTGWYVKLFKRHYTRLGVSKLAFWTRLAEKSGVTERTTHSAASGVSLLIVVVSIMLSADLMFFESLVTTSNVARSSVYRASTGDSFNKM